MTTAQTAASGASAAAAATGASAPNAASAAPAAAAVERPLVRFQQKPLSVNINGKAVGPMQVPEGLMMSPIQQKFLEHFSFQCGYCTPGFVNAATVLIERLKREPVAKADVERTITEALNAHLCRCTGYVRYYEAVKDVVMTTPGLVKDAA